MWRDIFMNKQEAVLEVLVAQPGSLDLTRAVRNGDADTLYNVFAECCAIRRGMIQFNLDLPAPDFQKADGTPKPEPMPRPYAALDDD